MAEGGRLSPRWLLAMAALALVTGDGMSLSRELSAQAREGEALREETRARFVASGPELVLPGAPIQELCARAVALGLAPEAVVLTLAGEVLARYPAGAAAEVGHRPSAAALDRAAPGPLVVGPVGDPPRLLAYLPVETAGGVGLLRMARPLPGGGLPDRRLTFAAHALVLLLALVALGLALLPLPRLAGSESALVAYEAAMDRLKARGEESERLFTEERRRMAGELAELEALARAGELTAGMAHEVRNGLGTILGHARLLERDPDSAAAREAGGEIRAECDTLESVVRRFVEYVREERLVTGTCDLQALLRRVVAREGRSRPVATEVDVPPVSIEADEALLERALENLVRNALAAASSKVRVSVEGDTGSVRVLLEDDGPGLALPFGEALRPFRSARPGGLGLGLPLAAKLLRLHGGDLSLFRNGAWTRAEVVLPTHGGGSVTERSVASS